MNSSRRSFIKNVSGLTAGLTTIGMIPGMLNACTCADKMFFSISLAQWSLHRYFKRWTDAGYTGGKEDPLDFPVITRNEFSIDGLEYVNTFYYEKINEAGYLSEMKNRSESEGMKNLLIMVDAEGLLGDPDEASRKQSVSNHYRWVEAAKFLGCHSIRVNAGSEGTWDEQMKLAADGIRSLCEFADDMEINVIVENHGHLSSNGEWLGGVMKMIDHPRAGTLPDFGNFRISENEEYDRYKGVAELMPFAKGVSAKSHEFDEEGNETKTDYYKMLRIVKDAGFTGYVGIEYEGDQLNEFEGIRATKALLEKVGAELS
jgi:sugar phosphate isomerase/epimerase